MRRFGSRRPLPGQRREAAEFQSEMWSRGLAEVRNHDYSGASKLIGLPKGLQAEHKISDDQLRRYHWYSSYPGESQLWIEVHHRYGGKNTEFVQARGSDPLTVFIPESCAVYRTCKRVSALYWCEGDYHQLLSEPFSFSPRILIGERLDRRQVKAKGPLFQPLLEQMRKVKARYVVNLRKSGFFEVMMPERKSLRQPADLWRES